MLLPNLDCGNVLAFLGEREIEIHDADEYDLYFTYLDQEDDTLCQVEKELVSYY